jgi:hypothetical protein
MPVNLRWSASANGTRNLGQGGGQFLLFSNAFSPVDGRSVTDRTLNKPASSTADYYHMDGLYDFAPYDLNAMGSWGQTIATAKGYRYVWIITCDHPGTGSGTEGGWAYDATGVYAAFSNDPAVLPDPSTMFRIISGEPATVPGGGGTEQFTQPFTSCLVYNADDATNPAYLYLEMNNQTGVNSNSLNCVLWKGPDFDTAFTCVGVSHAATGANGLTSYQRVYRNGTGDWMSWGGGNTTANDGSIAKWTSTDGLTFTKGATATRNISTRTFGQNGFRITIGADTYEVMRDDDRTAGNGMYVSLVPVTASTGSIISGGSPAIIRVSNSYYGTYPTATYLQAVPNYAEDGIVYIYALHGFFGDTGLVTSALPENGGGLNEQYVDVYAYVYNSGSAANSAPCGVKASCAGGVVSLTWYDPPGSRTFRVYRGTTVGSQPTLVTTVTGTSASDSPTVGSVYYYKVVAYVAGVEQGSRIVSTYVS